MLQKLIEISGWQFSRPMGRPGRPRLKASAARPTSTFSVCALCEQSFNTSIPRGKPNCPSLRGFNEHRFRVRVARARQGVRLASVLYRFNPTITQHQRDGEPGRPLLRASTEHIPIVRGLRAPLAPASPAPRHTFQHYPSREASLMALHCARSTSTVFACALREQDRASGLPLSSIPIP